MFLYPKERQITMIGTRLQKTKLTYDKGQDATTLIEEVINKLKDVKYFNRLNLI